MCTFLKPADTMLSGYLDVNSRLHLQGNTVLHYAVSHCNFPIVNLIVDSGVADVNLQNKAGYTPIMLAALSEVSSDDDRAAIQQLLSKGNVNLAASQVWLALASEKYFCFEIIFRFVITFCGIMNNFMFSFWCKPLTYRSPVMNNEYQFWWIW